MGNCEDIIILTILLVANTPQRLTRIASEIAVLFMLERLPLLETLTGLRQHVVSKRATPR